MVMYSNLKYTKKFLIVMIQHCFYYLTDLRLYISNYFCKKKAKKEKRKQKLHIHIPTSHK